MEFAFLHFVIKLKSRMIKKVAEKLFDMKDKKTGVEGHADTIVRNHVVWSMGAGMIPVLIADIFAVSAIQLDMIRQMSKLYDVEFNELQGKAIVSSLTGSTVARLAARSVVKLLPGVGSMIGGVAVSVFAGASTYALGEVFKKHFESGGTILDFDPERVKQMYKEKFEKGKTVAKEWKEESKTEGGTSEKGGFKIKDEPAKKAPKAAAPKAAPKKEEAPAPPSPEPTVDIIDKLKDLAALKKAKAITDTEYKKLKKKLLEGKI